jgi:chemotaxis protein CheD
MTMTVDVADMKVAKGPEGEIATSPLSCGIALAIWDPEVRVGGVLHFTLPDSGVNPQLAKDDPLMFCDTAVPLLLGEIFKMGAERNRVIVRLAGGSDMLGDNGHYDVGKRNHARVRQLLSDEGILIRGEAVGGTDSRTLTLNLSDGSVTVRFQTSEDQSL